jgi:hypothetical protein
MPKKGEQHTASAAKGYRQTQKESEAKDGCGQAMKAEHHSPLRFWGGLVVAKIAAKALLAFPSFGDHAFAINVTVRNTRGPRSAIAAYVWRPIAR